MNKTISFSTMQHDEELSSDFDRAYVDPDMKNGQLILSKWRSPFDDCEKPRLKLVQRGEVEKSFQTAIARVSDKDEMKKQFARYNAIRRMGEFRTLVPLVKSWKILLEDLESSFPNFARAGVIDYLRAMCALAEHDTDRILEIEPILLNGPPGIGKTLFARKVAKICCTSFILMHMETAQSASNLGGSEEFWSNSKQGLLSEHLLTNAFANPVVMLDELDKANSAQQYSPLAPLYGLLERETAKTFADLSMPMVTIDTSRVMWIATSNDATLLPEPILSRMKQFDVPSLTEEESIRLVRSVHRGLVAHKPLNEQVRLSDDAALALAKSSPRSIISALKTGVGTALFHGRTEVLACDVVDMRAVSQKRTIGFRHN